MPRIAAPTLAEHQARQRERVVRAAVEVLAASGAAAVTPAAVGRAAGLGRSSVYQYFDSAAGLLAAAAEAAYADRGHALAAVGGIDEYVAVVLDLATTPTGRAVAALERAEVPGPCRDRVEELRAAQRAPLRRALRARGEREPAEVAELYDAAIAAGAERVAAGAPVARVRARLRRTLALTGRPDRARSSEPAPRAPRR